MGTGLHFIDYGVIVGYLLLLTFVGIWFSKRQKSFDEFFMAKRGLSWLPVGLSLMAALNSGLDYLMVPSAIMRFGYLLVVLPSVLWMIIYIYVVKVSIPFFRSLKTYSAYEYLENRFSGKTRTVSSIIFILWRLCWMGTALYVPCLAMSSVTKGELPLVPTVIVIGSVATLYCVLGGFRAVVWTGVLQFSIMFMGIAVTIAVIMSKLSGNFAEVFSTAWSQGRMGLISTPGVTENTGFWAASTAFLYTDITIFSVCLERFVSRMASYTADQTMIQRFGAAKSFGEIKKSFLLNAISDSLWMLLLGFVGLALFLYVKKTGFCAGVPRDEIFPKFISEFFPAGVIGLVIAAILAASLSSVAAAINSCSSIIIVDIYDRYFIDKQKLNDLQKNQERQVFVSRLATVFMGVMAIILASNVGKIGSLYEIMVKFIGLFIGPIFGLFILGMFTKRTNSTGVMVGAISGSIAAIYAAFFTNISFIWTVPCGLMFTLFLGYICSMILGSNKPSNLDWTFKAVMANRTETE